MQSERRVEKGKRMRKRKRKMKRGLHPLCNLSDYVARLAGKRYEYN